MWGQCGVTFNTYRSNDRSGFSAILNLLLSLNGQREIQQPMQSGRNAFIRAETKMCETYCCPTGFFSCPRTHAINTRDFQTNIQFAKTSLAVSSLGLTSLDSLRPDQTVMIYRPPREFFQAEISFYGRIFLGRCSKIKHLSYRQTIMLACSRRIDV